jgi:hypothetical protein
MDNRMIPPREPREYPAIIGPEELEKTKDVSDEKLDADIKATEQDVERYKRLANAFLVIAQDHQLEHERRLASYRSETYTRWAIDGRNFLNYLIRLRRARGRGLSVVEEIMQREG